ncbi:uncharacterized protein BJ212DRAFT_1306702 [Suillus subaureus]|uniref:Uncharacterized protein n=1 Tax=Suillus subaureus TaxID=48587 RepID=A0A9P7ARI5_9AGAM|nr:uncharacterized protein BJ212DRAFT_1306702 [Suillus subaureus]KAG1794968.1 hypothetical protein BJ212DRAFT_1306702 [Suillus subaureus]
MPELGVVNEQEFDTMDRAIYEAGWWSCPTNQQPPSTHRITTMVANIPSSAALDSISPDTTPPTPSLTYAEDPAIFAYETEQIASYVKELAPTKLVIDSTYSINAMHLSIPTIDIFSDHFYPPDIAELQSDISVDQSVNNAYIAGE